MIVHDVQQCSPAWFQLRLGIPTASGFSRILTPKTRKPSAQAEKYAIELVTEWALGAPLDSTGSQWMERGKDLEDRARAYYEVEKGVEVKPSGFITTDDGRTGFSADFLVGDDGGGEIKVLSAANHVAALFGATDDEYACQVQGAMWISGRQWWDRVWYNPALPSLILRVERDADFIAALSSAALSFCDRLETMKARLLALGHRPPQPKPPTPAGGPCKARREDGRWCMAPGVVDIGGGEWRCDKHPPGPEDTGAPTSSALSDDELAERTDYLFPAEGLA